MAVQRDEDGWETVTDPNEVPPEIRKALGVAGIRKAFGVGENDRPLTDSTAKRLEDQVSIYASLKNARGGFKNDFGGNTVTGDLENSMQGLYSGFGSEGQRDWWAQFRATDNQIRNQLFGAALSASEQRAYEATTVSPAMDPKEIRKNLEHREQIVRSALSRRAAYLKANGYKPEAVDALLGEYGADLLGASGRPGEGDPNSGVAGVAAGGSGAPPSGPGGPPDNGDRTVGGFADQLPAQTSNQVKLTDQQRSAFATLAKRGGSPEELGSLLQTFGVYPANPADLAKLADALKKNPNLEFGVADPSAELKPVDAGDGAAGAFARGVGNAGTLGFLDEIGAVADTIGSGGTYAQNLDRRRGQELYDEHNSGLARFGGQLLGGLPIGSVEFGGARQAARAAGVAAMRQGLGREVALMQANRTMALRSALEGAGIGAAYGAGESDGGLSDRAVGAGIGALSGGIAAGALTLAGSRLSRAVADRRAAQPAARAQPTEASRIAALADQQGVELLPQDIGGAGIGRMTQAAAQTPFGGRAVGEATDRVYNSFRNRVGALGGEADTLADVGGTIRARSAASAAREGTRAADTSGAVQQALGAPDDLTGAGHAVQRGVARFIDETAERANQLYGRVPIPAGAEAAVGATRAVLRDLNAGMQSNADLGSMFESPRLQGYLHALTPRVDEQTGELTHAGTLSWQDLQEFRTRVGDMLDDPRLSDKIAPRQLRALYGALTEDMEATARGQGENALRSWRRANTYYAARMKRVNDTLSMVVGDRRDKTPNEAMAKLQTMLRAGSGDDAASFGRVMRSIPTEDARIVRATIVNDMRGGRQFDPAEPSKRWDQLSERGKSALLPQTGLRSIMDDAADRAAASTRDPLANLSGEQAYLGLEKLANSRGDSVEFRRRLASMSADEASAVRSLFVHRMGLANAGAQNAEGDAFSVAKFLTRWSDMTPQAKQTLFGDAEMRSDMDALATIAERIKGSEKLRGYSNTGGIDIANKTGMGLASAVIALATGHPIVAAGLAAPPLYQRLSAEVLTSKTLLKWLARAPKKPNVGAQRAHIERLTKIASAEPAIANEVLQLQTRLRSAFGSPLPAQIAAEERLDGRPKPKQQWPANYPSDQLRAPAHSTRIAQ